MATQTFVVSLEPSPLFSEDFPRVTPQQMAEILRAGIEREACGLLMPLPFEVTVEGSEEAATTSGQVRASLWDAWDEAEQASQWGE